MIVRDEPDGSLILVAQTDHSKLSGVLAAHWGNDTFERPRPYESAVRAAMFHDCGWYRYETSPRLDPATGKTPNFMQVPLDRTQLDAFQWGTDWLTEIDPYAGLMINKHRTGLWRGRYGTIAHPAAFNATNLSETVERFIVANEARQTSDERAVDANEFRTNYQLLQVWDLLSLYFCVREPKDDYIEPVPTSYRVGAGVRVNLKPQAGGKVVIDPYPFDVPSLEVRVMHRRLPKNSFADQAEFRAAYYRASPQVMRFEFVAAE